MTPRKFDNTKLTVVELTEEELNYIGCWAEKYVREAYPDQTLRVNAIMAKLKMEPF